MKYGSLFSGIGGFDLGLDRAGMSCAWQVEINPYPRRILAKHWPDVPKFEDVNNVGQHNLSTVDLVCGGFPCQDVSIAGNRAGLAGERSKLWFQFHRILEEIRPAWVIVENVPGLLSSNGGGDFAAILCGLVELRYGVAWRILDAQYFGVPQRRRRVFIVGHLGDGRAAEVLFESEGMSRDSQARRAPRTAITGALSAGAHSGSYNGQNAYNARNNVVIANTLGSHHGRNDMDSMGAYITTGTTDRTVVAFAWQQGVSKNDRSFPVRGGDYTGSVSGTRVDAVSSPTIGVRRLTPTECERLQGFPDGWTADLSDSARYKALGNAVAVPCAEWIGRRIFELSD